MMLARRVCFIYLVLIAAAVPVLKAFLPSFSPRLALAPRARAKLSFQPTAWKKASTNQRKILLRSTEEPSEFDDTFFGAIEPEEINAIAVKNSAPKTRKVAKPTVTAPNPHPVSGPNAQTKPFAPFFMRKTFSNGDLYEGEWREGKKHGFGTYHYHNLNKTLVGVFSHGLIVNGTGTLYIFKNGFQYEGTWENGCMEGPGKHISKDGFVFEGMFLRGQKSGMGRQVYPGLGVYEGEWKNNVKHGRGRLTTTEGQVIQGEWRDDDMFNVKGERVWKDGTVFRGEMIEGLWQGPGVLINTENVTYTGTYVDGQLYGAGTVLFPDGKLFEADFKDGVLSKALVEVTK